MKKDLKIGRIIFFVIITIFVSAWIIYNIKYSSVFFDAPLYSILTFGAAIFLAFYMTQQLNKKRRVTDTLCIFLDRLETEILNEETCIFENEENTKHALMRNRRINNLIRLLEEKQNVFKYRRCCENLATYFSEYETLFANHIDDIEHLRKSQEDLRRPLDNMLPIIYGLRLQLSDY